MRRRTVKSLLIRAMLIALLLAALGVAMLFYSRSWAPSRSQYPLQGIAVSADQGAIEWNTVRRRDVDFAYIRATSGSDRTDPRFAVNWAGAREAGLRYGAVHDFSLCRLASDQATLFIATVPRDSAALPPVIRLAFDPGCADRPARKTVLGELSSLIRMIEAHGGKPALIRVAKDFDVLYDIGDGINRTLWLDGNLFPPDYAARPWVMWTASNIRRVGGIAGPVDWSVVRP